MSIYSNGRVQILKAGASSLYRGKQINLEQRVFGVPGASLHFANLDIKNLDAGIAGEERIAMVLDYIANNVPNTYVFHSVKLPNSVGDIDHLVVRGNVVIIVDTKNWKSSQNYKIKPGADKDYVYQNGQEFDGGIISLKKQMLEWKNHLKGFKVKGILAVANTKSEVTLERKTGYQFVNINNLLDAIAKDIQGVNGSARPMKLWQLTKFTDLVQNPSFNPSDPANYEWVLPASETATTVQPTHPKLLSLWNISNYLLVPLFGPMAFWLSLVPLIIVSHFSLRKTIKYGFAGRGLIIATLIFSYLLAVISTAMFLVALKVATSN